LTFDRDLNARLSCKTPEAHPNCLSPNALSFAGVFLQIPAKSCEILQKSPTPLGVGLLTPPPGWSNAAITNALGSKPVIASTIPVNHQPTSIKHPHGLPASTIDVPLLIHRNPLCASVSSVVKFPPDTWLLPTRLPPSLASPRPSVDFCVNFASILRRPCSRT
jgi:hypothetical protein